MTQWRASLRFCVLEFCELADDAVDKCTIASQVLGRGGAARSGSAALGTFLGWAAGEQPNGKHTGQWPLH